MKISEHANYLLNEYGRLQFDYAAYCKPYGESLRNEARNNLEEYIAELEDAQRWVPVSERLPEDGEVVWLWDGNNLGMGYYLVFAGQFMDRDTPLRRIKPTHWMPLPESPIVYGKACIDQLTAHDATERQDDKSPNDTQTQTIVYGKEREE
ncbi:MAG: hypothetical protein BWY95_02775 [Bacteroidetes bacterium ADurb.BinA104]|nr:MAG: hypothetical protein BWY95_02775 [Bacteroidetes bacterium ADurb.BinA104]